jgi:hypothetical protein
MTSILGTRLERELNNKTDTASSPKAIQVISEAGYPFERLSALSTMEMVF